MIMILFGALSAGTKTYLLCRSDRQAFTSAFCNTLPVDCLKFCFSFEIRSLRRKRVGTLLIYGQGDHSFFFLVDFFC